MSTFPREETYQPKVGDNTNHKTSQCPLALVRDTGLCVGVIEGKGKLLYKRRALD